MKKSLNISKQLLSIILLATTAVATIVRCVQVRYFIDADTGFYTGGTSLKIVLYAVIAVSVLFFILSSFLSENVSEFTGKSAKSKTWFVPLIVVIAFVCDAATSIISAFSLTSSQILNTVDNIATAKVEMYAVVIRFVFAALSAIYFIFVTIDEKNGTDKAGLRKILAVCPVVWAGFRMIALFVSKISFLRVSDLFLQIVTLAFVMLFLMAFAQYKSDVYSTKVERKLFAYGSLASMMLFITGFQKVIFTFVNGGAYLNDTYPLYIVDIVLSVFIFFFLYGKKEIIENKETES